MSEPNSDNKVLKRHSEQEPMPNGMTRAASPALPAQNPYLDRMTREDEITDEMKKPLYAREKPTPAEAVFPAAPPAEPVAPRPAAATLRPASAPAPAPMARHQTAPEELARNAWRYTRVEDLPAPPPKEKKKKKD